MISGIYLLCVFFPEIKEEWEISLHDLKSHS